MRPRQNFSTMIMMQIYRRVTGPPNKLLNPQKFQKLFQEMKDYAKALYPGAYDNGFGSIVAETLAQPKPEYNDYFSKWENVLGTHAALNKIGFYQVSLPSPLDPSMQCSTVVQTLLLFV